MIVTDAAGTHAAVTANATTVNGASQIVVPATAMTGFDAFAISMYDGPNGTGNVLASGTATATIAAGAANVVNVTTGGVVSTIAMSIGAPFILGSASALPLTHTARDAAGNVIIGTYASPVQISASGYYSAIPTSGTNSNSAVVTNSSTAVSIAYSGGLAGSNATTIQANATTGSTTYGTLYVYARSLTDYWAYSTDCVGIPCVSGITPVNGPISQYSSTLLFSGPVAGSTGGEGGPIAFDAAGNAWGNTGFGTTTRPDGTVATTTNGLEEYQPGGNRLPVIPFTEQLLAFDATGTFYTSPATATALDVYTFGPKATPVLVRTIPTTLPPCSAAVDTSGNLYVGSCVTTSGTPTVAEYTTGGSSPIAVASNASSVQVDGAGNVYALVGGTASSTPLDLVKWAAGASIATSPTTTVAKQIAFYAVQRNGDICANVAATAPAPATPGPSPTFVGYTATGAPSTTVCPSFITFAPGTKAHGFLAAPIVSLPTSYH